MNDQQRLETYERLFRNPYYRMTPKQKAELNALRQKLRVRHNTTAPRHPTDPPKHGTSLPEEPPRG